MLGIYEGKDESNVFASMSGNTLECNYSNINHVSYSQFREYFSIIRKARTNILKEESFAGTVSMNMDYIIADVYNGMNIETACTNGRVVIFSQKYMEEKLFIEIQATLEHETWHVALAHPFRVNGRDHELCNIAGDYSVNGIMVERYPQIRDWNWLYDDKLSKMSMEAVYEILKKDQPEEGSGGSGKGNENEHDSKEKNKDWENAKHGQFIEATNKDGSPLTKEEFNKSFEEHREFINVTRSVSKGAGIEFGGEKDRHIKKVIAPKLHWKIDISRFVSKNGSRMGMNPMKFSRQKLKHGIFYPDDIKKGATDLGMGLDVSSSMDEDSLNLLMACMEEIRKRNNIKTITIVPFNSRVIKKSIKVIKKGEKIPKSFAGWGGTRFSPVFDWFNDQKKKPDMVIIFTDLGSSDYGNEPKYPVMWASSYPVVEYSTYNNKPPFGRVIEIEP